MSAKSVKVSKKKKSLAEDTSVAIGSGKSPGRASAGEVSKMIFEDPYDLLMKAESEAVKMFPPQLFTLALVDHFNQNAFVPTTKKGQELSLRNTEQEIIRSKSAELVHQQEGAISSEVT